MVKRVSIVMLGLSSVAVAAAYAMAFLPGGAPPMAAALMVVAIPTMMVAVMVLGAARHSSIGPLWLPFGAVWLIVVCGFGAALWLPADTAAFPHMILGLPRRAAIVLYGVGLLPLLGMPLAYAATFDRATLSDADLAALREKARHIIDGEVREQHARDREVGDDRAAASTCA